MQSTFKFGTCGSTVSLGSRAVSISSSTIPSDKSRLSLLCCLFRFGNFGVDRFTRAFSVCKGPRVGLEGIAYENLIAFDVLSAFSSRGDLGDEMLDSDVPAVRGRFGDSLRGVESVGSIVNWWSTDVALVYNKLNYISFLIIVRK
jgi:hypothetical protein